VGESRYQQQRCTWALITSSSWVAFKQLGFCHQLLMDAWDIKSTSSRTYIDTLLGKGWHFWGINEHGDYAHVDLQSVEFYLSKQRKFVEYTLPQSADGTIQKVYILMYVGYSLNFSFKRKWGNASTFGKDKNIIGEQIQVDLYKCLLLLCIVLLRWI